MVRMKRIGPQIAFCLAEGALLILTAFCARGEQDSIPHSKKPSACLDSFELHSSNGPQYQKASVIEDPGTGHRWLLVAQVDRPQGPARLVEIPASNVCFEKGLETTEPYSAAKLQNRSRAVIHTGDSVVLSQRTPNVDAQLEAIALQPAAAGNVVNVRLKFSGHVIRVVATAPGRVALPDENNWFGQ